MKRIYQLAIVLGLMVAPAFGFAQTTKYKCMIQMTNYTGEDAYLVVSLVDAKGAYSKTLAVFGSDKKWYPDLKEWHKFYKAKPANISAVTGASVAGGDRATTTLDIETAKLDAGYKIRFETAVEDNKYYVKDIEIPATKAGLEAKTEGTGYIRYVRFAPAQ